MTIAIFILIFIVVLIAVIGRPTAVAAAVNARLGGIHRHHHPPVARPGWLQKPILLWIVALTMILCGLSCDGNAQHLWTLLRPVIKAFAAYAGPGF
jgi:hypothetical protein